jgi:hypothetical protein
MQKSTSTRGPPNDVDPITATMRCIQIIDTLIVPDGDRPRLPAEEAKDRRAAFLVHSSRKHLIKFHVERARARTCIKEMHWKDSGDA